MTQIPNERARALTDQILTDRLWPADAGAPTEAGHVAVTAELPDGGSATRFGDELLARVAFGGVTEMRTADLRFSSGGTAPAAVPGGPGLVPPAALVTLLAEWGVTDGIAANQWHLAKLGDLGAIWKDYSGKGVSVGVYDSGIDTRVAELKVNYDASKEVVVDGKLYAGTYRPYAGSHGTAVAGLIAAAKDGQGTIGLSYDAKVTGVNIFDQWSGGGRDPGIFINQTDKTRFFDAIRQADQFDIMNNSWGQSGFSHDPIVNRVVAGSYAEQLIAQITHVVDNGRDGLGTIAVKSAGNTGYVYNNNPLPYGVDGNNDSMGNDRHFVSVAAYREGDGYASSYSTRGAQLLISGPSSDFPEFGGTGVWTTDPHGRDGANTFADPGGEVDYTDGFGGTSASAPIVSGVIGLMLDANEGLGWRDVKNILAASAKLPVAFDTGPTSVKYRTTIYNLNEDRFQIAGDGASSSVNGGGYHYSTDYGYGAIDAYNAVRMAEVWQLFGAAQTSANEAKVSVSKATNDRIYPGVRDSGGKEVFTPVTFKLDVTDEIDLEHVELFFTYSSPGMPFNYTRLFQIKLTSPDGTTYNVNMNAAPSSFGPSSAGPGTQVVSFAGLRGETSKGEWTVSFVYPYVNAPTSVPILMENLKMDFYGSEKTAGDVYSYTDEFFTMAAIAGEEGRRTLSDTDGGTDWINAAAVSKDVAVSLVDGQWMNFGGVNAVRIARGTQIENIVTGDGNDTISGNALDNEIRGMRGNDNIFGAAGSDRLYGGTGDDRLDGGTGADLLDGGAGNDTYVVDDAGDFVIEGAGDGTDTVYAGINYTLTANVENLYVSGAARIGTGNALDNGLYGTNFGDTLYGLDGNDLLKGWGGNDTLYGGAGSDRLEGAEGNDVLDGGTGADTLEGGLGNDTYYVDNAGDVVTEWYTNGQGGTDTVYASISWTLGNNIENLFLTGGAAINATGNALNNVLRGNGGANVLRGGAGDDTLIGLGGDDTLFGGAGADTFVFGAGFGKDTIRDFGAGDVIDLASYQLDTAPVVTDRGADTLIDLGNGNIILLIGIDPDQLTFTGNAFGFAA